DISASFWPCCGTDHVSRRRTPPDGESVDHMHMKEGEINSRQHDELASIEARWWDHTYNGYRRRSREPATSPTIKRVPGRLDPVWVRAIVNRIGNRRGMSVLDCGCGEGELAAWLASSGARRAIGVDVSREATRIGRVCTDAYGLSDRATYAEASLDA